MYRLTKVKSKFLCNYFPTHLLILLFLLFCHTNEINWLRLGLCISLQNWHTVAISKANCRQFYIWSAPPSVHIFLLLFLLLMYLLFLQTSLGMSKQAFVHKCHNGKKIDAQQQKKLMSNRVLSEKKLFLRFLGSEPDSKSGYAICYFYGMDVT